MAQVALESLLEPGGVIALSVEPGFERDALFAGTMIGDILRGKVSRLGEQAGNHRLHLHVGSAAPAERTGSPCLHLRPGAEARDSQIPLDAPWNTIPAVQIPGLRWAEGSTQALTQEGDVWRLDANLPEVYGREALKHPTADGNMRALLGSQLAMRSLLSQVIVLDTGNAPALSLITIDAEDQQRYFINSEGRCSNIRGTPDTDMQFANSCRTIMDRCESAGLKAVFMVTGDELDPSFVDAFGDPLTGRDDNLRVLGEMPARGHDVAFHGYDHEWWISRGRSAITPMTFTQKLRYFFETSGDLRTIFGLARFLAVYGQRILKARAATKARGASVGQDFTDEEMRRDFDRWSELTGHTGDQLFVRYPGYVRSAATLHHMDERYRLAVDSSDLYEPEWNLPAFAYRLFTERDGVLRRARVIEVPCIWIDKLLRTPDSRSVERSLEQLARLAAVPGSILCFITHTKVLGATWGHCHVYLHDPLKGMALPASRTAWESFARFLSTRTRSANWRDLQQSLGAAA